MAAGFLRDIVNRFPPPKYLFREAVGIDLGDNSLRFLRFEKNKGHLKISSFGEDVMPEGSFEGGDVINQDEVVALLTKVKKVTGSADAIASLPEDKAYVSVVELPNMKQSQVGEALNLQLDEHFPLSPGEAVFDFEILKKPLHSEDNYTLLVTAFPRATAESFASVFDHVGMNLVALEIESQSVARAATTENDRNVYMVVNVGKRRTGIFVVSGGKVFYSSTISIGGEDITNKLATAIKVDYAEAEKLKREKGLVSTDEGAAHSVALAVGYSAIRDEVGKRLNYWNVSHDKKIPAELLAARGEIQKVFLSGGESVVPGLRNYLGRSLGIPVEPASLWQNAFNFDDYIPEITEEESVKYATAIGLALRGTAWE